MFFKDNKFYFLILLIGIVLLIVPSFIFAQEIDPYKNIEYRMNIK